MHAGESLRSASAKHLKKNCLCVVLHMVRNCNDNLPAVTPLLVCCIGSFARISACILFKRLIAQYPGDFLFKRFIAQYPGGLLQPESMTFCILRHIHRVYTARYAGESKDFNLNMDKVLHELSLLEASGEAVSRRARFRSVVTLILDGKTYTFEGVMEGEIAREKSGNGGFGYDPIFIPLEYPGMTAADITEEQKNEISHRGKALRAMSEFLNRIKGTQR